MKTNTNNKCEDVGFNSEELVEQVLDESWVYAKTVVDVVHEPVLILNKNFCVMAANEAFYRKFQVDPKDTEGKDINELGNGQWNIPALRRLLEEIKPDNTFFKGFEVIHNFPYIGNKIMILNARQIHFNNASSSKTASQIIILTIEDVTKMMVVAETIINHVKHLEMKVAEKPKP